MTSATTGYEGPWRRLANISASAKGSIHDDEAARGLGFRGGFVPGSTVATAALPAVISHFGQRWFEGGWCSFTFVSPVYVDEEVHEVGEPNGACLDLRVENRDQRLCCSGRAGLGFEVPWDATLDGKRGAAEVLPAVEIGVEFDAGDFTSESSDVEPMLDAAGDQTPWYKGPSPWGAPLLAPERLHNIALQFTRIPRLQIDGVRNPGMWAAHDLTLRRPLFLDQTYRMTERVADKGRSGRTIFITYEFEVFEGHGEKIAAGRHKIKWLALD